MERGLDKWLRRAVTVDEIQLCFMPERGTIDAVLILRRLQGEYHAIENGVYVFCGHREVF